MCIRGSYYSFAGGLDHVNAVLTTKPRVQVISDDTDMQTTLTNGYLQNVVQRYVLGVEPWNDPTGGNMQGEGWIMENYMNFPPFKNPQRPTLREANDRVFYLANNLFKKDCGNFQYGELTYVINPLYQDKFFVAPGDTGSHASQYGVPMPMGTLDNFYHLIQPRFQAQPTPTLAQIWALSTLCGKNSVSVGSQSGQHAVFSGAYSKPCSSMPTRGSYCIFAAVLDRLATLAR